MVQCQKCDYRRYPERLYKALMNSSTVLTVWNGERLVGLARVLDDTEMLAQIHYVIVHPDMQYEMIKESECMQLLIKQKVFSFTDTYDVYDSAGNPRYYVKAEFFTIGHRIHVYDMSGNELGVIKQKVLTFMPSFEIEISGKYYGRVVKRFTMFKPKYDVDYNGWRIEGNFMGWDYDVYDGSHAVMHISKELFRWGDTYVIDIMNHEEELMGLMLVIAIDAANCSDGN